MWPLGIKPDITALEWNLKLWFYFVTHFEVFRTPWSQKSKKDGNLERILKLVGKCNIGCPTFVDVIKIPQNLDTYKVAKMTRKANKQNIYERMVQIIWRKTSESFCHCCMTSAFDCAEFHFLSQTHTPPKKHISSS